MLSAALPIANEIPLFGKHRQVVLHVADGCDRVGRNSKPLRHRGDEGTLVMTRRRHVEVVVLGANRGRLAADRFLHRCFAALQPRKVRTGADDLAGFRQMRGEIRDDGRIRLDRQLLVRDVLAVAIARVPAVIGEQPDIDAERIEHVEAALRHGRRNQVLLDRPELAVDDRAAVERADRQRDRKRLDQKAHARWSAGWRRW
jgi:hypothetical protein